MKINANVPLATIAAEMPGSRALFESLGIDYACGGQRSLADAAHAEGIDPEIVIAGLRLSDRRPRESWSDRPLRDLIAWLVDEHHHLLRDEMRSLALWLSDACARSSRPSTELQLLRAAFMRLSEKIIPHLHEEEALFTEIESLEAAWQSAARSHAGHDVRSAIGSLIGDHAAIAAELRTIRDLRLRIMTANDMTPRTRRSIETVALVEAQLHECMFLENCILFPRAIAIEQQIAAA